MAAINDLDGYNFKGRKIRVSMAKYDRNGMSFDTKIGSNRVNTFNKKPIRTPAFRDRRRYSDVLKGMQKANSKEEDSKIILFLFTLNMNKN